MLFVDGLPMPFYFSTRVPVQIQYMGVLEVNGGYIPYELTIEKKKNSRRKV